jgi:hypothetical protein
LALENSDRDLFALGERDGNGRRANFEVDRLLIFDPAAVCVDSELVLTWGQARQLEVAIDASDCFGFRGF